LSNGRTDPSGGPIRPLRPGKNSAGPAEGDVTVEMKVEIEPGAPIARHAHPGVESGYASGELRGREGRAARFPPPEA